jgi:hypothetical protein
MMSRIDPTIRTNPPSGIAILITGADLESSMLPLDQYAAPLRMSLFVISPLTPVSTLSENRSLNAGGPQEETDGKDNGIQLRGFAFEHFEGIDRLELRHEEKKACELFLPTGQLRNRTPISTRVFSYGVTEAEKFRSLGRVELTEVGRDFILVVVAGKDGYEIYPVRADDPDFRGNDSLVFNLTKYRLEILLGDAQTHLEPWKNSILRPHHAEDAGAFNKP